MTHTPSHHFEPFVLPSADTSSCRRCGWTREHQNHPSTDDTKPTVHMQKKAWTSENVFREVWEPKGWTRMPDPSGCPSDAPQINKSSMHPCPCGQHLLSDENRGGGCAQGAVGTAPLDEDVTPGDQYAEMERVAAEYAALPEWVKPIWTGHAPSANGEQEQGR